MKQYFAHYGFNESYYIAKSLVERVDSAGAGAPEKLAALVFIAFTYESALNHLGELAFSTWNSHFERISPEAKLLVLIEKARIEIDTNAPPFQSFKTVTKLRNNLAHHKVEKLKVDQSMLSDFNRWPKPKWVAQARSLSAAKALADLDEVILMLENALNVNLPPRFLIMEHIQE